MPSKEREPKREKASVGTRPINAGSERAGEFFVSDARRYSQDVTDGLGIRIREAREETSLGMAELAEMIEISPSYLSKIETGKAIPPLRLLGKIAHRLDINVVELFTDDRIEAKLKEMLPVIIPEIAEETLRRLLGVSPSLKRDLLRIADSLIHSREEKPTGSGIHNPQERSRLG